MALALLAALSTIVVGAPVRLNIGDPAPALTFGDALKGSPVRTIDRSKVTVVEFWATWCKPCVEGMPHVSQLWAKYQDRANFVGVSVMENDQKLVKPFVERLGDKVTYPLALDKVGAKDKGFMYKNWLEAAGQKAIPVAFVVDRNSKVAWIGAPAAMEPVLAKVIDGTWDAMAYRAKFEADLKNEEASTLLVNEGHDRISRTVRTHSYAETVAWIDRNRKRFSGPDAQQALDEFKKLFSAFARGDYSAALQLASTEPTNGLVWTYFRPMLLIARIDALQSLNRSEWREVALKSIDEIYDPNFCMAMADAFALPDSKLAQRDAEVALKAGNKLAGLARVPMFLIRLAWAQIADKQFDQAKATLDEALKGMAIEKQRNAGSYDDMMRRLKEAKAYVDKQTLLGSFR